MATWNGVITNAGNSLLNEWVTEKTLSFTRAAAGQGTVPVAGMMAQTALVSQKQAASLLGGEEVTSGIRLKIRIVAPDTAYTLNQFGVWASVANGTAALLALFQLESGISIPSKTDSPDFVYTFYALISCSNTGSWTVTVDTSACVTQSDMTAAIATAAKAKQDKITAKGLLMGDGSGNISAAVAGKDYGYPLATGSGAPTTATEGAAGQHYYDSSTGKEYVCKGKNSSGEYIWSSAGASDASDLTYNGQPLDEYLSNVEDNVDKALLLPPVGVIVLWSGAANTIPAGWALCNGQNGTPDLRDRFVIGAGLAYTVGATGGEETVTLTAKQIPEHTHSLDGFSTQKGYYAASSGSYQPLVNRGSSVQTTATGSGNAHNNMPPYYALCYIMRIS